ncbi:MAG: 50S ribosomal protein L9 [Gammaproteobacteria bacterium]|nr:50S ribosomal protein L9 [Gammaproteobacteria bacterium]
MEVILLEEVQNLGKLGDCVAVKSGYARNYLIPGGKALVATAEKRAEFEKRRSTLEASANEALDGARTRAEALTALEIIAISARTSAEGKLFGSVGALDIANALSEAGVEVQKREVRLPTGPLHELGDYEITIHLHPQLNSTAKIAVVAEES